MTAEDCEARVTNLEERVHDLEERVGKVERHARSAERLAMLLDGDESLGILGLRQQVRDIEGKLDALVASWEKMNTNYDVMKRLFQAALVVAGASSLPELHQLLRTIAGIP